MSEENKNLSAGQAGIEEQSPVENIPEEIISSDESITEQPKTDNMEVHKHPHHITHKKKWGEYLLEFLMLFLAVFLGFLAENQREHYIEQKREKQYAGQLLTDLRQDSVFFKTRNDAIERTFAKSWIKELFAQQQHPSDTDIIRGFLNVFWSFDVKLTNTTFSQMKTSGSLRYIRNSSLTTELQKYYDVLSERVIIQSVESRDFLRNHMLPWYIKHIKAQDLGKLGDSILNKNTVIIDRTDKTDQEVLNITDTYRLVCLSIYEKIDKPAAMQADILITLIKKEYHLE